MKKIGIIVIGLLLIGRIEKLHAQSLSPKVIATAGGFSSNAVGSLSFTIGETSTRTLTSANQMLTQGFQQSFKMSLMLKAFIQGYYQSAGEMQNVLYNEGVTNLPGLECDSILVELRNANYPYAILYSTHEIIKTNGVISFSGNGLLGMSCYVVLKHRNAIETWSANPVLISENTSYDFTVGANKAYGDNQIQVEPGVFAFFAGDINSDENIDLLDAAFVESDISNFTFGYFATDINGDGNVDLLDAPIIDDNVNNFVFAIHP